MMTKTRTSTEAGGVIRDTFQCNWYTPWLCEECDYPDCASFFEEGVKVEDEVEVDNQLKLFEI